MECDLSAERGEPGPAGEVVLIERRLHKVVAQRRIRGSRPLYQGRKGVAPPCKGVATPLKSVRVLAVHLSAQEGEPGPDGEVVPIHATSRKLSTVQGDHDLLTRVARGS